MRNALKVLLSLSVIVFLLYKYVYLQFGLIQPDLVWTKLILFVLLILSAFLAGSETALTSVDASDLEAWHTSTIKAMQDIDADLSQSIFDRIPLIRPTARLYFNVVHLSRTNLWVRKAADGKTWTVDIQNRLTMIVACNNIININMVILLTLCLSKSSFFLNGAKLPLTSPIKASFLDNLLPLAGDAGFSAVGVTVILLLIAELVPKKIAYDLGIRFLYVSSFAILPLTWLMIPGVFSEGMDIAVSGLLRKLHLIKP